MRAAYAQQGTAAAALHFKPVTENEPYQSPQVLTEGDQGEDPARYSPDHVVVKGRQGTIFAFQNGIWVSSDNRTLCHSLPHNAHNYSRCDHGILRVWLVL
jgi:hypothetical protein